MPIEPYYVPRLLVKGVAPDGKEYRLDGVFGEWTATLTPEQVHELCETSKLNKGQVRALWDLAGRTDRPPNRLKIYLQENAEFCTSILMGTAFEFATAKLAPRGFDKAQVEQSLLVALRGDKIKSWGQHRRVDKQTVKVEHIEFNTADFIKWLELEHEIRTDIDELSEWDRPNREAIYTKLIKGEIG